jgi:hypothetical protein
VEDLKELCAKNENISSKLLYSLDILPIRPTANLRIHRISHVTFCRQTVGISLSHMTSRHVAAGVQKYSCFESAARKFSFEGELTYKLMFRYIVVDECALVRLLRAVFYFVNCGKHFNAILIGT